MGNSTKDFWGSQRNDSPDLRPWKYNELLSLKAKAIFAELAEDLAAGQNVTIESLAEGSRDGVASVRKGFEELKQHGYIRRIRQSVNGRFVWTWEIDPFGQTRP